MAAGVAGANGHTDQGYKLRSLVNSFRHGKKAFTSSVGVHKSELIRPFSSLLQLNVNVGDLWLSR